MNRVLRLFLYNMWEKSKGPGDLYVWLFILALMAAYASLFSSLVEIFGTTTRIFPSIYLAIAALSWGLRGAIPVVAMNTLLNIYLYYHTGRPYEGGALGPLGCLFATSLVGMISDLARQLDSQLKKRLVAEAALRVNESRYRKIFNTVSDALFLINNENGKILEANASAVKIYGYTHEELLGMYNIDVSAEPDDTQVATDEQRKRVPVRYHKKKNGTIFPVEITAEHFSLGHHRVHIAAIRDISFRIEAEEDKKRLEGQFYHAQKMKSIGTLAGGIAHDFNNLLGGIMGHASLGLLEMDPGDPSHERFTTIMKLTKSGGNLTKHLLGFARGGKYQSKPTDINEMIFRHNQVFGRTHKHIAISETYDSGIWATNVDRGQIEQVLLNIYINAVQAMPNGGTIYISTENAAIGDRTAFSFSIKPGKYIKVSIRDTGTGMDEETRDKVFEPFFSTKEKAVGTGLGMAAAYGIIKNHGGYIHVLSELGHGTTVTIYLPYTDKEIIDARKQPAETIERGSGTLLVVDDEEDMLNAIKAMVQMMGYHVLTASSGKEAIGILHRNLKKIDLVLLDMVMPHMNGTETFKQMKAISDDIKVLFQTGYGVDNTAAMQLPSGCNGVIQKPFTIGALSQKIKDVIYDLQP